MALDTEACRDYAAGGIINTDDNLYLEFASPLNIGNLGDSSWIILRLSSYRSRPLRESGFLTASASQWEGVRRSGEARRESLLIEFKAWPGEKIAKLRRLPEDAADFGPARRLLSLHLMSRGIGQIHAGNVESAFRSLREAVELHPKSWDAQIHLGLALLQLGRFEESIVSLQRALELRPNRWWAHDYLSLALAEAGRVPEAVESLRAAIALNPNGLGLAERPARLTNGL